VRAKQGLVGCAGHGGTAQAQLLKELPPINPTFATLNSGKSYTFAHDMNSSPACWKSTREKAAPSATV
jgi:hypothetical protein